MSSLKHPLHPQAEWLRDSGYLLRRDYTHTMWWYASPFIVYFSAKQSDVICRCYIDIPFSGIGAYYRHRTCEILDGVSWYVNLSVNLQLFAKSLSTPLSDREKIEKIPKLPKFKRRSSTALLRTIQPPGTHSVLGSPYDNICHPENDRISMISKEHQHRRATSTIGQLSQSWTHVTSLSRLESSNMASCAMMWAV